MSTLIDVPLASLEVGRNVRSRLDAEDLVASIAAHGVLTPVLVSRAEDSFRLIAGHRRVAAAKAAGLSEVPALVIEDPGDPAALQVIENIHRRDLDPMDRARAIRRLLDGGISQKELAKVIGMWPSEIANDMRLLRATPELQEALGRRSLTRSHAVLLASLPEDAQRSLVFQVISRGLSTTATAELAKAARGSKSIEMNLGGHRITIGIDGPSVDLTILTPRRGLMLAFSPEDADLLGRRLRQAAEAARLSEKEVAS